VHTDQLEGCFGKLAVVLQPTRCGKCDDHQHEAQKQQAARDEHIFFAVAHFGAFTGLLRGAKPKLYGQGAVVLVCLSGCLDFVRTLGACARVTPTQKARLPRAKSRKFLTLTH
jgi:hypothetical protein